MKVKPGALALLCALLTVPGIAVAQDSDEVELSADDAAFEAGEVHDRHCATVAADTASKAADALSQVSDTWAMLNATFERTHEPHLVYWRGLVAQCLDQEAQAIEDLRWFLAAAGDLRELSFMAADARRRLSQMGDDPEVRSQDPEVEAGMLIEAAQALFEEHCDYKRGQRNTRVTPAIISSISDVWGRLGRATEQADGGPEQADPDPMLVYWRGTLALCLGQEERAVQDLSAYLATRAWTRRKNPSAALVVERLLRIEVHVDRFGQRLTPARVARRVLHLQRRVEVWGGGGLMVGGLDHRGRYYAGTQLGTLGRGNADDPWWAGTTGNSTLSGTQPALGRYSSLNPELGGAGSLALGIRTWAPTQPLKSGPSFGFGLFASLYVPRAIEESWVAQGGLECDSSDPGGNCMAARYTGWAWKEEGRELARGASPRLVLGPEFSLRFAPDSLVTPVLHFAAPAVDVGLRSADYQCIRASATPEGTATQWREVDAGSWERRETRLHTLQPIAGAWSEFQPSGDLDRVCRAAGVAPPFLTARLGLAVEVRPRPQLVVRFRTDLQPLLWGDAILGEEQWPRDDSTDFALHRDTFETVLGQKRATTPVLADFRMEAGLVF